jgi:hypothetical protein
VAYISSLGYHVYCYSDAVTVKTSANVELRYSPRCRTAWARQTGSVGWLTGVVVQSFNTNGSLRVEYRDLNTSGLWSAMVNDAGLTARACFYFFRNEVEQENDNWEIENCTARY